MKASDEDLRWLYPEETDEDVAGERPASGPVLAVVTRGGDGVYAVSRTHEIRRTAVPVDLVDTVRAGDSFTSGPRQGAGARSGCTGDVLQVNR